jgi:hypothetical protein
VVPDNVWVLGQRKWVRKKILERTTLKENERTLVSD